MKIEQIFSEYLNEEELLKTGNFFVFEQDDNDPDAENDENPDDFPPWDEEGMGRLPDVDPIDPEEPVDAEPVPGEEEDLPGDLEHEENLDDNEILNILNKEVVAKPKKEKFSPLMVLKNRWKQDAPGLTDGELDNTITVFNTRKNGLRPFDPRPNARNMFEVVSLKRRFPNFPVENVERLRDIQSYNWEQMEFLMDAFMTEDNRIAFDYEIIGDTQEDKLRSSLQKWEVEHNRVVHEIVTNRNGDEIGTLTIYRVEGKDEAYALGLLQNNLCSKFGGHNWCITNPQSTYYSNYRSYRSYYFVRDTSKPESHRNYVSVLQPINPSSVQYRSAPFIVTARPNDGDNFMTWYQIVAIWPQIQEHQDKFSYFGTTKKETIDVRLDLINEIQGDPHDLAIQSYRVKQLFIDAGRCIHTPEAFSSLPLNLQENYVRRTSRDDYRERYRCSDVNNPLGMLNVLLPRELRYLDEVILKRNFGIVDGIIAIKGGIFATNYRLEYTDQDNRNIKLYQSRFNTGIFGVINLETLTFLEPVQYTYNKSQMVSLFRPEDRSVYQLQKFSGGGNSFYWLMPLVNLKGNSGSNPTFLRGKYLDSGNVQSILTSGEYKRFED